MVPDKTERAEIESKRERERDRRKCSESWGMRNEGKGGLYASGYAHTMGPRGKRNRESKSGELIVARAADEAAAIYGPDLWAARIYHRGHTHTRVRAWVPLPLSILSSLSLFSARSLAAEAARTM